VGRLLGLSFADFDLLHGLQQRRDEGGQLFATQFADPKRRESY
jgi:hypothetical protein